MTDQPGEQANEEVNASKLRIMQINLNKSEKAHLDIINEDVSHRYDIMLIQEPYTTQFNAIRTPANFRPVFPRNRIANESQIRSVIWVSKHLETKNWKIIDVQGTQKFSRPDNVFCDITLQPYVQKCEVTPQHRPTSTDHFPVETQLDLPQSRIPQDPSYNFRTADWDAFKNALAAKLDRKSVV